MNLNKITLTLSILFFFHILIATFAEGTDTIDRKKLVTRHNPTITKADPFSPFTVGNGCFAFTTDITGLQTFPQFHQNGIPLGTLSDWGWHTIPPKNHFLPNGHCYQRENFPTYLPANGGLLTTVAMMASGWDGAPNNHAPGFPKDGTWKVKYENLEKMP